MEENGNKDDTRVGVRIQKNLEVLKSFNLKLFHELPVKPPLNFLGTNQNQ